MRDVIERLELRWRGKKRVAPAHELRLEAILNRADLRPRGLPPQAVFVIREVRGLPPLTPTNVREWLARVQDAIDRQYRSTVQPMQQEAWRAPSVLFRDPAAMLTCLVQDVARGHTSRWYWRRLAGEAGATPGGMLMRMALEYARYLPAALTDAQLKDAVAAAGLMDAPWIRRILKALQNEYHLPSLKLPDEADCSHTQERERLHDAAHSSLSRREGDSLPEITPIWREWLPPLPSASPLVELLLGLCTTLDHAPVLARRPSFAVQTDAWMAAQQQARGKAAEQPTPPESPVAHDPLHTKSGLQLQERVKARRIRTSIDGISTRLGGAFYLLNLMKWLGLPHDWQTEQISPWDILAGLSLALLGETPLPEDRLWEWFAKQAQRDPKDPIGAGLQPPADYQAPSDWMERFSIEHAGSRLELTEKLSVSEGMRDWLEAATGCIRSLLVERTGTPDLSWLIKPAHVQASRMHLDVCFSLEAIDINVRRAGLDLNPEWLPDFRCIVHFCYGEMPCSPHNSM